MFDGAFALGTIYSSWTIRRLNLAKVCMRCGAGGRTCSNFPWGELASMYFHGSWHCPGQLPHLPSPIATLSERWEGAHTPSAAARRIFKVNAFQRNFAGISPISASVVRPKHVRKIPQKRRKTIHRYPCWERGGTKSTCKPRRPARTDPRRRSVWIEACGRWSGPYH
jgi:hypothetical protein